MTLEEENKENKKEASVVAETEKKFSAKEIQDAVNKVCSVAFKTRDIRERTKMKDELFDELGIQ